MIMISQYGAIDELNKVADASYPVIGAALLIWGAFWGAARLRRGAVEVSDDEWKSMVNDPSSMYAHKDGSIRDKRTDEVVFEYKRPPENWDNHDYCDYDFIQDEADDDFKV